MARINWETSINGQRGFQDLLIAVGNRQLAKGMVLELFELAQLHWFPDRRPIPLEEFEASGLPAVLYAPGGLAELRDGGVYVRGSETQFQWLFDAVAGGVARAKTAKRSEDGRFKPKKSKVKKKQSSDDQQVLETAPAVSSGSQVPPGSLLSSLSSSLSSPSSNSELSSQDLFSTDESALQQKKSEKVSGLIARYCELWKAKYKSNPDITGKDVGILKRLAKDISHDRMLKLLEAYFAMPDAYTVKARHPVERFEYQLKVVAVYADSGRFTTQRQAGQYDDLATNMEMLDRVKRGEL